MNIKKIASVVGRIVAAPFVAFGCYVVFTLVCGGLVAAAFWDAEVVRSSLMLWTTPASFGVGVLRLLGMLFTLLMSYGLLGPKRSSL